VQALGFTGIGLLTPLRRLYPLPIRQASALPTASSRFHLAMDTLAVNTSPCRVWRGLSPPSECALPGAQKQNARRSARLDFPGDRRLTAED